MLVSVFGYFFYIIAAFATIMTLLIGISNGSTLQEDIRHYPRATIEPASTATNIDSAHLAAARGTRQGQLIKRTTDTAVSSVGRTGIKNRGHGDLANVQKFARQHDNDENDGHAVVLGYAEGFRYSPGLEDQR